MSGDSDPNAPIEWAGILFMAALAVAQIVIILVLIGGQGS